MELRPLRLRLLRRLRRRVSVEEPPPEDPVPQAGGRAPDHQHARPAAEEGQRQGKGEGEGGAAGGVGSRTFPAPGSLRYGRLIRFPIFFSIKKTTPQFTAG